MGTTTTAGTTTARVRGSLASGTAGVGVGVGVGGVKASPLAAARKAAEEEQAKKVGLFALALSSTTTLGP